MAREIYLTKEGYEKLKAKYDDYINFKRAEASEKIKIAREYGDISENAEYDAAKDEQAMIESEIKIMEEQLSNAKIIEDEAANSDAVTIGSYVMIHDLEYNEKMEYQIVGSTEADIYNNRISNDSPMAKALLGKKKGAKVLVDTGSSSFEVKILNIHG